MKHAPLLRDLAPEEIERLVCRCSFVDLVEAIVAVQLLHVVLARVAVTAEDLNGGGDAVL